MAFRMGKIGMLRLIDYKKFSTKMKKTIAKHEGIQAHIAQDLDVGETTLKRWLREDDKLRTFIDRVRSKRAA